MKPICIHHLTTALCALLLLCTACTEQELLPGATNLAPGRYRFSVSVPEPQAATRALGDRPQNVTQMPMHVLVFDENGFFLAFEVATVESFDNDAQHGTYTVGLPPSGGERRILHFVLGEVQFDDVYLPTQSEAEVMGSLRVSNGTDAYWQRMEVDDIPDNATELEQELGTVTLVRNFAKISVVNQDQQQDFELTGFVVVNETTSGTVAPYAGTEDNGNGGFAKYLGLPFSPDTDPYTVFTTANPGYGGTPALGGENGNVDSSVPADGDAAYQDADPKYVYERNQDDASNPACLLIYGTYGDTNTPCYYKLDIVRTDQQTWITSYLNLYRNFHYTVRINNVYSVGYATPEEAMRGAAANNIGASVEVSEVNTIQDGRDQLWVSTLDTLLVSTAQAEIRYEFRDDINGTNNVANDRVVITPVYDGDNAIPGNDGQGMMNPNAIQGYSYNNGVLTVTPAATLPNWIEEQEFVVAVQNSGLSRRIRVRVRQPFQFVAVDCEELVPEEAGSRVNLITRLPENMPPTVFPLVLDIEPRRKTVYPDAENNTHYDGSVNRLPVSTDKDHSFSYQATVTWEDYRANYTQYYAFLTNVDLSQTYFTVTNPYFVDSSEGFNYPDIDPDNLAELPLNVARFRNDARYDFFDVSLSSTGGSFTATPDNTNKGTFQFNNGIDPYGHQMTLNFKMHRQGDDFSLPHDPVEIYIDYGNNYTSTTGTIEVDEANHRILYTPYDDGILDQQSITFTIDTHYAQEEIQLSSYDHENATVTYKPQDCVVTFEYYTWTLLGGYRWEPVPRNETIEIYDNSRYSGQPIGEYTVGNNNGQVTIILSGRDPDMVMYFQYSEDRRTDHRGSATVRTLAGSTIQLQEN